MEKTNRFYENPLFVWALLFISPPLGILFLWIINFYHVYLRVTISILFGLLFLNYLGMESSFLRVVILVLIINVLWLRNVEISKHKEIAKLKYNELYSHFELIDLLKSYLMKYETPTSSYYYMKYFEEEIVKKNPILNHKLTLSNSEDIYIQTIFHSLGELKQRIDIDLKKMKQYETDFLLLTKLILKKFDLKTEKIAIYYVWTLLKQIAIDYYSEEFMKLYGNHFKNSEVKDMISVYIKNEEFSRDIESKERILLTYFLMKCDHSNDFIEYSNKVEVDFQKQIKLKIERDFEFKLKS